MQTPVELRRLSLRLKNFGYSSPGNYFVTICTHKHEYLFGEITDRVMILNRAGEAVRAAWFGLPERFPSVVPDVFVIMPNHFHGILTFTQPIPRAVLRQDQNRVAEFTSTRTRPQKACAGTTIELTAFADRQMACRPQKGAASSAPTDLGQRTCSAGEQMSRTQENAGSSSPTENGRQGTHPSGEGLRSAQKGAASVCPYGQRYEYPTLGKVMRAFKSLSAIAVNRVLGRMAMPVWQRNYFERVVRHAKEYERIRKYIVENPQRWNEDGWDAMPDFANDD